jgi:tetratricopeptide (TPR) repeat protein
MMIKKHHFILGIGVVLVLVLYFGFSIRSTKSKVQEKSRSLVAEVMSGDNLIREAKDGLDKSQLEVLVSMEQRLSNQPADSVSVLKEMASFWYKAGNAAASGVMAEKIATTMTTAESWSICGTTYVLCLTQQSDERIRQFCASKSRAAFENAISLEPENTDHRINLAISFVESPPQDNPMKGVLMLRELNEANPENVNVLYHLAKLALKTGQVERAITRVEEGLALEPDNTGLNCLAVEVYELAGNTEKAGNAREKCEKK